MATVDDKLPTLDLDLTKNHTCLVTNQRTLANQLEVFFQQTNMLSIAFQQVLKIGREKSITPKKRGFVFTGN